MVWEALNSDAGLGRTGRGVRRAGPGCLLVAFEIAAFRICARVGLIPHAKQGGSGVWALAVEGSKFDGTGLEKLQMVQTQVAVLAGGGSTGGILMGLSVRVAGEGVPLPGATPGDRVCREERLVALGISVILADDLRNPAWTDK